jgi:phosphoribosylformimino-5-aminoimidazole carboxamide ribotide isomerase
MQVKSWNTATVSLVVAVDRTFLRVHFSSFLLLHFSVTSVSSVASLHLIPVIDLKAGMVVHAREGRRAQYAPIRSSLCKGAHPETIMAALLDLHPFRTIYFADLDAIQRVGSNRGILGRLHERFPAVEIWADTGIADAAALRGWISAGLGRNVIGSESLGDVRFMDSARELCVLSLDFTGTAFSGPAALLQDAGRWPTDVLAMNLQRVGSDAGPDLELIAALAAKRPDCRIYAAGGVRSVEDLRQVSAAGAAGALLASALHDGRIGPAELSGFQETH